MRIKSLISLIILLITVLDLPAQDSLSNGNALNIPFKKYGISIGNSYEFNGIRINFADKNVKRINGVNITFWINHYNAWEHKSQNYNSSINGISLGLLPTSGTMQPINLGLFRVAAEKKLNGLSISGINIRSNGNINGICLSGLATKAESTFSGIAMAGFGIGGMKGINGLAVGGIAVATSKVGSINGAAACLGILQCGNNLNGLGISGIYLTSNSLNGLAIACIAKTNQTNGLSIAIFNKTKELHGVQIGLWNCAQNNPKGLRKLPIINMHFGKTQQTEDK